MLREYREIKFNTALMVLHVLSRGPAHGYELMKRIEEEFHVPKSPGILYPVLSKLLKDGFIEFTHIAYRGKKSLKIYKITDKGLEFLNKNSSKVDFIKNIAKGVKTFNELGGAKLMESIRKIIELLPKATPEETQLLKKQIDVFTNTLEELRLKIYSR